MKKSPVIATIAVELDNKTYLINKSNLIQILNLLSTKDHTNATDAELLALIKQFELFDPVFLKNINKI